MPEPLQIEFFALAGGKPFDGKVGEIVTMLEGELKGRRYRILDMKQEGEKLLMTLQEENE